MKKRYLLISILAYILSVIAFYFHIEHDKKDRIDTIFEKNILNIHTHYMDFIFDKSQLADMIHKQIMQSTKIIALCTKAYQVQQDSDKLRIIRDELSSWRQSVFIDQDDVSIHSHDAALFSACLQIETLFADIDDEGIGEVSDFDFF